MQETSLTLITICLLLISHDTALACRCLRSPTVSKAFNKSAAVFFGKVLKKEDYQITFKVDQAWKGEFEGEVKLFVAEVKVEADRTSFHPFSCVYNFAVGEKYLVYADSDGGKMFAQICSRTRPEKIARDDFDDLDRLKGSPGNRRRKRNLSP